MLGAGAIRVCGMRAPFADGVEPRSPTMEGGGGLRPAQLRPTRRVVKGAHPRGPRKRRGGRAEGKVRPRGRPEQGGGRNEAEEEVLAGRFFPLQARRSTNSPEGWSPRPSAETGGDRDEGGAWARLMKEGYDPRGWGGGADGGRRGRRRGSAAAWAPALTRTRKDGRRRLRRSRWVWPSSP